MRSSSSLLSLALATIALRLCIAQSPPASSPATANSLSVTYGNIEIRPAGVTVSAAGAQYASPLIDVANPPNLALGSDQNGTYIVVMMDLSVETDGLSAPNTTLIHWLLPGLSSSPQTNSDQMTLQSNEAAIAPYYPPGPPPNQTHTYAFYLYSEPISFSLPANYGVYFQNLTASVYNRIGFNLTDFAEKSGLGDPVAADWFIISSMAMASASSSGVAASAPKPTTSAAERGEGMGFFVAILGTAGGLVLSFL